MKIEKDKIENRLRRLENSDGKSFWHYQRNLQESESEEIFWYSYTIPDEFGVPSPKCMDYLLKILNDLEVIQLQSQNFIKGHLSIQSEFSLQGVGVLEKTDKHEAEAILHYWCEDDGYLYTEIGLLNFRPHYLLIKYW